MFQSQNSVPKAACHCDAGLQQRRWRLPGDPQRGFFAGQRQLTMPPSQLQAARAQFEKFIPIIGSCPKRIELKVQDDRRQIVVDESESSQMDSRVHYIRFTVLVPDEPIECAPCAHCGATLYLRGRPRGAASSSDTQRARSRTPRSNYTYV